MANPFVEYYANQAGSGLSGFEGYQYQRGHGFFGSLFSNIIKPLGKYLGKQAISTGVNIGRDFLQGENLNESLKKNAKITGKNMLSDTLDRAQKFAQTGSGKRRRRRKKTKSSKKLVKKVIKKKKSPLLRKKSKKRRSKQAKFIF